MCVCVFVGCRFSEKTMRSGREIESEVSDESMKNQRGEVADQWPRATVVEELAAEPQSIDR